MPWPWNRPQQPVAVAAPPEPVHHHSLALKTAMAGIARRERPFVVDLGGAVGANVEFFTERGCRLQIADLQRTLGPTGWAAEPEALARHLAEALPVGQPADLILAWDLLNYLDAARAKVLLNHLASHLAPQGSLLFLLSTIKEVPAQALRYRIENEETLAYTLDAKAPQIQAPRFHLAEIEKMVKGLKVEGSWLVRSGVQEFLLVPKGGKS